MQTKDKEFTQYNHLQLGLQDKHLKKNLNAESNYQHAVANQVECSIK